MLKHFSLILKMHFLKILLLYTLLFSISNNSIAQQKDTVSKKENGGLFKHMKVSGYVLPDADKDGVTDQFDKELNTVKGCPVDAHGVSLDTDKDGVIDCKDKEPLTQRDCFPVDTLGKGLCPDPSCCDRCTLNLPPCKMEGLYGYEFNSTDTALSFNEINLLDSFSKRLNEMPACILMLQAYSTDDRSRKINENKIQRIIKYFTDKNGIAENRLIFNLAVGGNSKIIDFIPINDN